MSSQQYRPNSNSICRIITADLWNQVIEEREWVPLNELDKKDGFVHLSTVDQVLETLNRYFVVEQNPLILILDRQIHFDDITGIWKVDFQETFRLGQYIKIEECLEKVEKRKK